jgi:hypothetical protein
VAEFVLIRALQRSIAFAKRRALWGIQRSTGWGIDKRLEQKLRSRASAFVAQSDVGNAGQIKTNPIEDLDFTDSSRYSLIRDDIYRRFVVSEDGPDIDRFGRNGRWIPRGSRIFLDRTEDVYVKIFDEFYCAQGEGRFLPVALEQGIYGFLCPALAYLIEDRNQNLRGYAIRSGRILSLHEFERYVEGALREALCELTRLSGLYFYDLNFHNFIVRHDELSMIDLESVLPLTWFGKDRTFSQQMFQQIDVGYPIQEKFHSPSWYAKYIEQLLAS